MTHDYAVKPVRAISPVDPKQVERVVGYRAECECGWKGLTWSVPAKHHARASIAVAHAEADDHRRAAAA